MIGVRATTILLTILLLSPAAWAVGPEDFDDVPGRARLAMVKASAARDGGRLDEAVDMLLAIVEERPGDDHPLLRYHLGNTLMLADREAEAVTHFTAAVAAEPAFGAAWLGLGQAAYAVEDYATAGDALERAYRHDEDPDPTLLYYAGASLLLAADPAGGARVLEDLVSGAHGPPELDWYRALVSACVDLDDHARGDRAVRSLLAAHPDASEAWRLAFQHAASHGDNLAAAVALRVKSHLAPLDATETVQLADLYRLLDVPVLAGELYASVLDDAAEPEDFERLVATHLAAHDGTAARRVLDAALAEAPTARLWSLLGDLASLEEDYATGRDAFAAAAEMDPDDGRAALMLGWCLLELDESDEAVRHLERARGFPDQAEAADSLLRQARRSDTP